jgi:polyisoprenoid-binding protein YceI
MSILSEPTVRVPTGTWDVDPVHTTVSFSARHAGVSNVRGIFHEFEGTLEVGAGGAISGGGSVATATVDTRSSFRDEHLRSADFFEAETYPRMTYRIRDVEVDGEDITVTGDLTMRGVTHELVLRGEILGVGIDDDGNTRLGLSLAGQVSRAAYGMRFNQALGGGNVLVGDRIKLSLDISLVKRG